MWAWAGTCTGSRAARAFAVIVLSLWLACLAMGIKHDKGGTTILRGKDGLFNNGVEKMDSL